MPIMYINFGQALTLSARDGRLVCDNSAYAMKDKLKAIPTHMWNPGLRRWTYVPSPRVFIQLLDLGFKPTIEAEILVREYIIWKKTHTKLIETLNALRNEEILPEDSGLIPNGWTWLGEKIPFNHQIITFLWGIHLQNLGILNEMGTGKTRSAIDIARYRIEEGAKQVIVVCPAFIVLKWMKEFGLWGNLDAVPIYGSPKEKKDLLTSKKHIIKVISYATLSRYTQYIDNFDVLIADESSYCKHNGSLRTKTLKNLTKKAHNRYILTGSLASGNMGFGVWPQLQILTNHQAFCGITLWKERYYTDTTPFLGYPTWQINDGAEEEISRTIYQYCIRYRKDECLDLPPKNFVSIPIPLSLTQEQYYRLIDEGELTEINSDPVRFDLSEPMFKNTKLRQVTSGFLYNWADDSKTKRTETDLYGNKIDVCMGLVNQIKEEGNKVVIWTNFDWEEQALVRTLKGLKISHCLLTGGMSDKKRFETQERFQENPSITVCIAKIKAAKMGIDLFAANYAIYYSLCYAVEDFIQSQDRTHRAGQTKNVTYYLLCAEGTVDEEIVNSLTNGIDFQQSLLKDKHRQLIWGDDGD